MSSDTVLLSITLCEARGYQKRRAVMFKKVAWPGVPREREWVFFGMDENGDPPGWSAEIKRVYWGSDGGAQVEATHEMLREWYDACVEDVLRDGFTEDVS